MANNYYDLEWDMIMDETFDRVCVISSNKGKDIEDEELLKEVCKIEIDIWCAFDRQHYLYSISDQDFEEMCVEALFRYEQELKLD